jgi:hypothetical protein
VHVSALDDWAERNVDRRDHLACRALIGEPLTDAERVELETLNAELAALLPLREPLPDHVLAALAEMGRV